MIDLSFDLNLAVTMLSYITLLTHYVFYGPKKAFRVYDGNLKIGLKTLVLPGMGRVLYYRLWYLKFERLGADKKKLMGESGVKIE